MSEKKKDPNQQFTIDKVVPKIDGAGKARVDVHVAYPGGVHVFDFPAHFTSQTILAQVRLQLRTTIANTEKYASLLGKKHDL